MIAVTPALLEKTAAYELPLPPRVAAGVVRRFGGAAPWFLTPSVLRTALEGRLPATLSKHIARFLQQPTVPSTRAGCVVLFVLRTYRPEDAGAETGALQPAFAWPLCWRRSAEHSNQLPRELHRIADEVKETLGALAGAPSYHLVPDSVAGLADIDLSPLDTTLETCRSAWASLAVGLHLAVQQRPYQPSVAISAAWEQGAGFSPIRGAAAKIRLAAALGCQEIHIATTEVAEARAAAGDTGVVLKHLPFDTSDAAQALAGPLHAAQLPPALDRDGLQACLDYANGSWPTGQRGEQNRYVMENITPARAAVLRRQVVEFAEDMTPEGLECHRLCLLLSAAVPAAALSLLVFQPEQALILHTPRDGANAETLETWLADQQDICCRPSFECLNGPLDLAGLKTMAHTFLQETPPEHCVADVTGGIKAMSIVLWHVASSLGVPSFQVQTMGEANRYAPTIGSERLALIAPGSSSRPVL